MGIQIQGAIVGRRTRTIYSPDGEKWFIDKKHKYEARDVKFSGLTDFERWCYLLFVIGFVAWIIIH